MSVVRLLWQSINHVVALFSFSFQAVLCVSGERGGNRSAGGDGEGPITGPRSPPRPQRRCEVVTDAIEGVPDTACAELRFFCNYWPGLRKSAVLPTCYKLNPLDFFTYLSRVFILERPPITATTSTLTGPPYPPPP